MVTWKRLLAALLCWLCGVGLQAAAIHSDALAGDSFNNGGGLAEAHIAFVWQNLERYLDTCKQVDSCTQGSDYTALLTDLRQAMVTERMAGDPMFKSERENPGFFVSQEDGEEAVQSFKTGNEVGSRIFFNLDKIYITDAVSSVTTPLALPESLDLVFQALSQHHKANLSKDEIRQLGKRVADLAKAKTTMAWLSNPFITGVSVQITNLTASTWPLILISDQSSLYSLTTALKAALKKRFPHAGVDSWQDIEFVKANWDRSPGLGSQAVFVSSMRAKSRGDGVIKTHSCRFSYLAAFRRDETLNAKVYDDARSAFGDVTCEEEP